MNLKQRAHESIEKMPADKLLRLVDFMEQMTQENQASEYSQDSSTDYLAVRAALSTMHTPLSDSILEDRTERI